MSTFAQAIADAGGGNHQVIADGEIHRITGADDKPGSNAWWYVSFSTAAAFGSWKLGFKEKWHDNSERSKATDAALAKQIKAAQEQRQADIDSRQKHTQEKALHLWGSGSETILHAYSEKKQITPYGARQMDQRLLIPMYCQGDLWNVQQIQPDGTKRFLKGGLVSGCYMPIGTLSGTLLICEGYATGCTLHEHTGWPVAVAFNAGNIGNVAKEIRRRYPGLKIIVAADNDTETKGNPGLTKGRQAAAAVGGDVLWPEFSDESFSGSDFNDYLNAGGKL